MKRKRLARGMGFAVAVATVAAAAYAHAQAADEYHVIVLDQTGSMAVPGQDHGNLGDGSVAVHTEVFDNALNATINWLLKDKATARNAGNRRAYAVYTFKDDNCCGGSQGGLKKIWPVPVGTTAPVGCDGNDFSSYEAATGFCLFTDMQSDPYDALVRVLDSIRVSSGDPNNLLSVINTGSEPKGGASYDKVLYGLGPNTALANALCDAAEQLVVAKTTKRLVFTLETDGGENFSPWQTFNACSGTTAGGLAETATSFPKTQADWGLPTGHWQSNSMRRITRFNQPGRFPPPLAGGPAANDAQDKTIISAGPITTPPDDVLANSAWRIDVHFAVCDPGYPAVAPCTATSSAAMASPMTVTSTSRDTSYGIGDKINFSPVAKGQAVASTTPGTSLKGSAKNTTQATTLAAATPLATTASSGRTKSIAASELSFFASLGHVNSKSTFRQFVRDPAAAQPVHVPRIPGDVDDSGCTDRADLSIIRQADVYYQRAALPNQLAIRADLNGDQWVNRHDAQIVLDNWGRGCINPVGPKPILSY